MASYGEPLLMTACSRLPLGLLRAPFLANPASLSWGTAFLEVSLCRKPVLASGIIFIPKPRRLFRPALV